MAWVALHGRTAQQRYAGRADWGAIAALVSALASAGVPVLGNGDIWTAQDAVAMVEQTSCAGVVVGRGCLGRPWLFGQLAAAFRGMPVPADPGSGEVIGSCAAMPPCSWNSSALSVGPRTSASTWPGT